MFIEPIGVYLQADAGVIQSVSVGLEARRLSVVFAPPKESPAKTLSYSKLRLRVEKTSLPGERPGSGFKVTSPAKVVQSRSAFEIPADADAAVTVVVSWEA